MKQLLFFILSVILSYSSLAQKKEPVNIDQYLSRLPNVSLEHPAFSAELPQSENHFSKFTVVDYRSDESRAGICFDPGELQVTFNKIPIKQAVDDFLNKNYSTANSARELVIVLKKLWYSSLDPAESRVDGGLSAQLYREPRGTRLQFVAESYLKTANGFVPFSSFDTIILTKQRIKACGSQMLTEALNAFVQKLNSKNIERIVTLRKPFDKVAVDSMSCRNFQSKIYKVDSLKKGVYTTAKEFFNNEPSTIWYEIQYSKDGMSSLYLKNEKGQLYLARSVWGFCDGQTCYVMIDNSLFPVYKKGNAFFVLGSKLYMVKRPSSKTGGSPYGALGLAIADDFTPNTNRQKRLFALDDTTGEVL